MIAEHATAWQQHAAALAQWTLDRLVNRSDAWGAYLPIGKRKESNNFTAKAQGGNGLSEAILQRHYRGALPEHVVGLHAISPDNVCRWIAYDIDAHGDGDTSDAAQRNLGIALELCQRAGGLMPILTDSNGRGGLHVRILFSHPVASKDAFHLGHWIARGFKVNKGTDRDLELFPKQVEVNESRPYGNWLRLYGRHHTRDHWTRVYDFQRAAGGLDPWLAGDEAIAALLANEGVDPELILAHRGEYMPPPTTPAPVTYSSIELEELEYILERARLYVARIDGAIGGQNGHDATLYVACRLVLGFNLTIDQAFSIMAEWNARCQPPWSEADLRRKLAEADKKSDERGYLLRDDQTHNGRPAAADNDTDGGPHLEDDPAYVPKGRDELLKMVNRAMIGQYGGRVEVVRVEKIGSRNGVYHLIDAQDRRIELGTVAQLHKLEQTAQAIEDQTGNNAVSIRRYKKGWPRVVNAIQRLADVKQTTSLREVVKYWLTDYVQDCQHYAFGIDKEGLEHWSPEWKAYKYPDFGDHRKGVLELEGGTLAMHFPKFLDFVRSDHNRESEGLTHGRLQEVLLEIGFRSSANTDCRLRCKVDGKELSRNCWLLHRWKDVLTDCTLGEPAQPGSDPWQKRFPITRPFR